MSEGIDSKHTHEVRSRGARRLPWAACAVFAAAALTALCGCDGSFDGDGSNKINGSIEVPAGRTPGAVATVNGSIHIDDNVAVTSATTVNGAVQLGDHASATLLSSVNGSITLGNGAKVSGTVSSVNGAFTLGDGADVAGTLSNVNGRISLNSAHVGGGIKTFNGGMDIAGSSHVEGGILVQKPSGDMPDWIHEVPRIVIGPGATVQGDLRFERTVQLYVSDEATIGAVSGATPIPFAGDPPPN